MLLPRLPCWGSVRDGGPLHLASREGGWPYILMDTGTDAAMDPQGGMSITGQDKLELDGWYHIAATYHKDELKWIGRLDEVRISGVAREPEELSPNLISVICKI